MIWGFTFSIKDDAPLNSTPDRRTSNQTELHLSDYTNISYRICRWAWERIIFPEVFFRTLPEINCPPVSTSGAAGITGQCPLPPEIRWCWNKTQGFWYAQPANYQLSYIPTMSHLICEPLNGNSKHVKIPTDNQQFTPKIQVLQDVGIEDCHNFEDSLCMQWVLGMLVQRPRLSKWQNKTKIDQQDYGPWELQMRSILMSKNFIQEVYIRICYHSNALSQGHCPSSDQTVPPNWKDPEFCLV